MMKGNLTIIGVDGRVTVNPLTTAPNLETLQAAVGGHIETVPYFTHYEGQPCVAFCNEEGKLKGLPVNGIAQQHWNKAFGETIFGDCLVGPIAIITGDRQLLESL